jgi:hypothetical protein
VAVFEDIIVGYDAKLVRNVDIIIQPLPIFPTIHLSYDIASVMSLEDVINKDT